MIFADVVNPFVPIPGVPGVSTFPIQPQPYGPPAPGTPEYQALTPEDTGGPGATPGKSRAPVITSTEKSSTTKFILIGGGILLAGLFVGAIALGSK